MPYVANNVDVRSHGIVWFLNTLLLSQPVLEVRLYVGLVVGLLLGLLVGLVLVGSSGYLL